MTNPQVDRPHMPDYGVRPPSEGTGLLDWAWAEQRLAESHDYWLASVTRSGRPHLLPLWGIWRDAALWFSCGPNSTKAVNLGRQPWATATNDVPSRPVSISGPVTRHETDPSVVTWFTAASIQKYEIHYEESFFASNALFRLHPVKAIGLDESDFTGSPTRWRFPAPP